MLIRGRKASQYIFFEMLPAFLLGLLVFIFILLMFQALRLTEFALIHGVTIDTIFKIMGYLSISFLPALFPMALLFAIILTYNRMSTDSEIVALKACGLSMISIATPAVILSMMVAAISAQTSFHIAPWGNRQFELIISKLSNTKAGATIREGAFSEGFFDLVVYSNKVDSKSGQLSKVFIFDEKPGQLPIAIIAKTGQLVQDPQNPGHSALLRLNKGDIHRKGESHTKIKFDTYDIKLFDPIKSERREKSPQSLTITEIREKIKDPEIEPDLLRTLKTEFHKRWAVSIVCLIFALLAVGISTSSNRRNAKSGGLIVSLGVIILYWILYVSFEGLARSGKIIPWLAVWTPNFFFAIFAAYKLRKNWN
jgi:lipopolysaccharide export system permease protein